MNKSDAKLSLPALTALVVGSMIGAGIFSLPATFGRAAGGLGAIIAWCIAGGGMLTLALVFQTLATRKPHLNSGIFIYAQDGFGNYLGFTSALGFWAGTCIGNVSYFVLIKSTLGTFSPIFGDGNTLYAILTASIVLWCFHILVLRGVKEAAIINTVVTWAKIIPIGIFIVVLMFAFNADIFTVNFWGGPDIRDIDSHTLSEGYHDLVHYIAAPDNEHESLFSQVRNTMLVTVFVFLGIEGASVYSRLAKKRSHIGTATVFGFIGVLCILCLVTLLSYGVLLRPELAALRQPSMAGVLETIVGRPGMIFISIALVISVLGAYLSWSLLAAEVLYSAAKSGLMPKILAKENANRVPYKAVWLTNIFIQVFLIITLFTDYAFQLALELTSSLTLIPYFLVSAYALKLALTGESYSGSGTEIRKGLILSAIALIYSLMMIYAGGVKYLLLSTIIYGPGTILYYLARKENSSKVFTRRERLLFVLLMAGAIIGIYAIATGLIHI
ncbi:amino acid permease [Klebsiella grimontii]|uniref:amino acid permease n=1 Tax=Klebsiella grimontii TaxID=2058152 RepID=UPI0012B7422B|nr:amino acid permease [Klebsiella grimontii]